MRQRTMAKAIGMETLVCMALSTVILLTSAGGATALTGPVQVSTEIFSFDEDLVTDECEVRIEGTGLLFAESQKKDSCSFECNTEDYVTVEVIDKKGRGRVSIVGSCEGARAECYNKVRECSERVGPALAEKSGEGECRAKVRYTASVDKVFRCTATSTKGDWEDPPSYVLCTVHWLSLILPSNALKGGTPVEVCYQEGNVVCIDSPVTMEAPEPIPWVYDCLPPELYLDPDPESLERLIIDRYLIGSTV